MHVLLPVALAVVLAAPAMAENTVASPAPVAAPAPATAPTGTTGATGHSLVPHLDVVVPVDPVEHERLHYFDGREHHLLPGAVSIGGRPYVCDLDQRTFTDRERFVLHLRTVHHRTAEQIRAEVMVVGGRVHFVGN